MIKKMKKRDMGSNVIAIIPARGGSKGIPGKNLYRFCGKPLLVWSIEQAKASKYIKDVYVSSDDEEIIKVSEDSGVKSIKRPKELASDTSSSEEALLHAINYIEDVDGKDVDIIVFLQATCPVRTNKDIDNAVTLFISQKADSLFSAVILEDFCAWDIKNGVLRSITYDYKKRGRRQERKPYYLENGSIYVFKPEIIKKYDNRLGGNIIYYPMPLWKSYEIDSIEDIEICEYYMKKKILKDKEVLYVRKFVFK